MVVDYESQYTGCSEQHNKPNESNEHDNTVGKGFEGPRVIQGLEGEQQIWWIEGYALGSAVGCRQGVNTDLQSNSLQPNSLI